MKNGIIIGMMLVLLSASAFGAVAGDLALVDYNVREGTNSASATVNIKNTASDTLRGTYLVEVQLSKNRFFTLISSQGVCDPTHPDNKYRLVTDQTGGSTARLDYSWTNLPAGTYYVQGVSVARGCFSSDAVKPFRWGYPMGTITVTGSSLSRCGDAICNANENVAVCPADCGAYLGDGVCSAGEVYPDEPVCEADGGAGGGGGGAGGSDKTLIYTLIGLGAAIAVVMVFKRK